uniref:RRM domain-containing protein n=1 Tax=Gasterosteus aculeatus TaxID=69293 RepID=G3NIE3_GASAC
PSRPRGPPPFQDHGRPLAQQPLQPLIPPHLAHRSPPLRPQMEPPPRMMGSPPPNFPPQQQHHHHQQQPPPHAVPLMPPAQSQPRPAVGPQRFPQAHGSPRQMTPRLQNPQQRNMSNRLRMQMQQRNSNLRELPVAPGNATMNSARPAANIRPVAKATQGMRPGQNTQPVPDGGRGRGQANAKMESQLGGAGPLAHASPSICVFVSQDPKEDEETRQYRLKIEEQKRLREEILKRKEMRRQMQAGVRKKELLDRRNTPSQGPSPSHIQPSQPQQHQPLRTQQSLTQSLKNPNQATAIPPNGGPQISAPRPNVKARLQMVKGGGQQQPPPGPGPDQQWKPPPRRNSAVQNVIRPAAQIQSNQVPQKIIPVTPSAGPGQAPARTPGPKPGAKRTVMQRAKSFEGQQVPQKVRVVKLSGASGGNGTVAAGEPPQPQGTRSATPLGQPAQRKVTMAAGQQQQQQQGPAGTPQAGRGIGGNYPCAQVVVPGRGRGRGAVPIGRGRPMATRQRQRGAVSERCTVSIEGLSSSTTDLQLQNLLRSIGPIEMFKMMPQQRKAVATFSSPQHAESFQMSFHRHMIDLSHIDVALIDG